MSLFKKLLGGTFEEHAENAALLIEQGRFGDAKLALERAISKSKKADPARIAEAKDKIRLCREELAKLRLAEADRLAADGDVENALLVLTEVADICDAPGITDAIQTRRKLFESEDARRLASEADEISEEELLAVFAGTWTESQAREYASLPDEFSTALLAGHDGEHEEAVKILENIVRQHAPHDSKYLWYELAKERFQAGRVTDALEAIDAFLSALKEGEDDETEIEALRIKATVLTALKRFDEAQQMLERATRVAPADHNTFLTLGIFLRSREKFGEAIDVLKRAVELMGQMHPDFRVIKELGFTYLALDRREEATAHLAAVVEHLASRGEHDQFDPEATSALARLYEQRGDAAEAADLFRHLAVGYDTKNHYIYNLEAARLLSASGGEPSLIERYLTRAEELAREPEQRMRIKELRDKIGR